MLNFGGLFFRERKKTELITSLSIKHSQNDNNPLFQDTLKAFNNFTFKQQKCMK